MNIDISQLPHSPGPDAVELTENELAALGQPTAACTYRVYKEPAVCVRLDGQVQLAAALERRDYPDGQIFFRLGLHTRPRGRGPLRTGWFRAEPAAMVCTALDDHPIEQTVLPGDAVRPGRGAHRAGDGFAAPGVVPYGLHGEVPVQVRLGGHWHPAVALRLIRAAGEPDSVRVRIPLDVDGWVFHYPRWYQDSPAIRPAPPAS
jgi:hypothetical protein